MAAGINVSQWEMAWDASQRWIFTDVGGGYYSVQTDNSFVPYYLGVVGDSQTLNADIVLRSGTLTDGMKWKIERTANEAYKLIPKTGEDNNYVLATTTSNATNGAKLIQGAYVDNNSYRDEWMICEYNYEYTVKYYYDEAYKVRYSSIDSNVENLIRSYHNAMAERFMKLYNIRITAEFHYCKSLADTCKEQLYGEVNATTINSACLHLNSHLTTDTIRSSWYSGTNTISAVFFTGHWIEANIGGDSNSLNHSVVIIPNGTVAESIDGDGNKIYTNLSKSEIIRNSTETLMHELAHQLGAPDHYCYNEIDGGSGRCDNPDCDKCVFDQEDTRICLMGDDKYCYSLPLNEWYCNECENIIKNHLSNHHLP